MTTDFTGKLPDSSTYFDKLEEAYDDLHWKKRNNYTLSHGAERVKIYKKEQFKYKLIQVNLDG